LCGFRRTIGERRLELPRARTFGGFGSGTSPLIAGERVILSRDVLNGAAVIALELKTGRKLWETARPDSPTSYSTAICWERDGSREVIVAGALALKAYDLLTGSERWQVRGIPPAPCTTPVLGESMLFFAGWGPGKSDAPLPTWESRLAEWDKDQDGVLTVEEFGWGPAMFRSGDTNEDGKLEAGEWNALLSFAQKGENVLLAVKPGGQGDVTETHVAWKATRGLPYVPSPVYYDGRVYMVKDGGLISSFDARTGEPAYVQERIPDAAGSYYASPVAADGRIYLVSLQGKLTVLSAGGDHPSVIHQSAFGERIAATPALVGEELYLRSATHLYAFGPQP
jgi:outer membrane protein assembly factor BamB